VNCHNAIAFSTRPAASNPPKAKPNRRAILLSFIAPLECCYPLDQSALRALVWEVCAISKLSIYTPNALEAETFRHNLLTVRIIAVSANPGTEYRTRR
jgi:hypothetical protein